MRLELDKLSEIIEKARKESRVEMIIGNEVETLTEGYGGLLYVIISIKNKTVEFTTDVPDYIWERGDLERTLEHIFSKLGIYRFAINLHHHKGKFHDKDINFSFEKYDDLPKIIEYVLETCYKSKDFDYCLR